MTLKNMLASHITPYFYMQTFTLEIPIFLRDHSKGMYRTDVYFLSKMIAEQLNFIIFPLLTFTIPYQFVGLNPGRDRFVTACYIIVLFANVSASYGTAKQLF